jgi:GDP/UDP-N,N'-diacetylbacillosamine 2-epimerase (hydrolysing)
MQKVCVISTTRADWGYLFWLCRDLNESDKFDLNIILPFNHHNFDAISKEFTIYPTNAVKSIKDFGQFYSDCYKIMLDTKPDMVVVLGDRFEMLAAATAALLMNTPIIHMYGGETTLGAFDNEIRNAITQMAQFQFTATEEYAQKIAEITGEHEYFDCIKNIWTFYNIHEGGYYPFYDLNNNNKITRQPKIYNVGSTGLDWLTRTKLLSKQELQQYVSIDLNQPFVVACFHPVTHELNGTEEQYKNFISALFKLETDVLLIFSNIDPGSDLIKQIFSTYEEHTKETLERCKIHGITNLDHLVYLSLLQYAEFMIGNSSSGIIESASFNIPSISVGNRQQGRIRSSNVFDCPCETQAIMNAVDRAREWNALISKCENVYGNGHSTERIMEVLETL